MKITTRDQGAVTILDLKGKLTIGTGDVALREAIQEALEAGQQNLLIDLKNTRRLDSSGLAELVSGYQTVTSRGGSMKLMNLPSMVRNPLEITQLITVFDIFEDEQEALASFGP